MPKFLNQVEEDLEIGATSECNTEDRRATDHPEANAMNYSQHHIYVRVVRDADRMQKFCDLITVSVTNQGEDLALKLRETADVGHHCLARYLEAFKDVVLMRHVSIWIAFIVLLSSPARDLEDQPFAQRVYVTHSECSELLTQAFHDPKQLRVAQNFVLQHLADFAGGHPLGGSDLRQALYIRKVFSKRFALIWFTMALGLSACAGIGVGIILRDIEVGFAIGGGMLAVLMALQCVIVWQVKS